MQNKHMCNRIRTVSTPAMKPCIKHTGIQCCQRSRIFLSPNNKTKLKPLASEHGEYWVGVETLQNLDLHPSPDPRQNIHLEAHHKHECASSSHRKADQSPQFAPQSPPPFHTHLKG